MRILVAPHPCQHFVVQSLNRGLLFAWAVAHQASLFFTISQSLFKLMSIESVRPSSQLVLCHPLLLPSIFPSIRVFSNESVLRIRCPKDWSFSFSISLSNEHSGLISFRMDRLDPLAVQGTLKGILQDSLTQTTEIFSFPISLLIFPLFHCQNDLCTI